MGYSTKDSGKRMEFAGGMKRDTQEGKTLFHLLYSGPMLRRWAELLTRGAVKYGEDNWMQASGHAELERFRASAARHFYSWMAGETDEDHGAAVMFNINGAEYVKAREDLVESFVRAVPDPALVPFDKQPSLSELTHHKTPGIQNGESVYVPDSTDYLYVGDWDTKGHDGSGGFWRIKPNSRVVYWVNPTTKSESPSEKYKNYEPIVHAIEVGVLERINTQLEADLAASQLAMGG